ncbi:lysyl oxidase family protein [Aeromicrobium marinum]|uniref:lysyl oxidase family protein n=1 Tax=Aeromicrobium marinum TaxID=219314 RepID=UPI000590C440|nr:lysyl oxidase family protein [Aeromicrobium marinum]
MPISTPVRRCAVAAVAVLLTACGASGGSGSAPSAASASGSPVDDGLLLPDLTTLPASSVQMDTSSGVRLLRFGTTLANVGVGPLELVPDGAVTCPAGERSFGQDVRVDVDEDGEYSRDVDVRTERFGGVCSLFHADHDHWHIEGSARYELFTDDGEPVIEQDKVSFCLRDTDLVPGQPLTVGLTYGACSRDALQGISPGWGDLYDFDLNGQVMPLPADLADGTYCLVMTADPLDLVRETDEDNNASVTPVSIEGDTAGASTVAAACADV